MYGAICTDYNFYRLLVPISIFSNPFNTTECTSFKFPLCSISGTPQRYNLNFFLNFRLGGRAILMFLLKHSFILQICTGTHSGTQSEIPEGQHCVAEGQHGEPEGEGQVIEGDQQEGEGKEIFKLVTS